MRKFVLFTLLASLPLGFLGCGEPASTTVDPAAEGPPLPGAPTEGPEVLKPTKSKKKG